MTKRFLLIMFLVVIYASITVSRKGRHDEGNNNQDVSEAQAVQNGQSEKKFKSKTEETKWKMNVARKKLLIAKDYLKLAMKATKKHKTVKNTPQNQNEIRDIIRKAEKQILHSGEKMGLSYMHYKRSYED
ncbi:hypothetical protein AC249_AIPGENE19132 [Exaiptasia diaphana]|nr:hypothetical protein AC249_AIPGENE19132 [Exaiptasia diaphana]